MKMIRRRVQMLRSLNVVGIVTVNIVAGLLMWAVSAYQANRELQRDYAIQLQKQTVDRYLKENAAYAKKAIDESQKQRISAERSEFPFDNRDQIQTFDTAATNAGRLVLAMLLALVLTDVLWGWKRKPAEGSPTKS